MSIVPKDNDPRNWQEDFPHENGNYLCKCVSCESHFLGFKRRITCKLCADNNVRIAGKARLAFDAEAQRLKSHNISVDDKNVMDWFVSGYFAAFKDSQQDVLIEGLSHAIRAANLALFIIEKHNVMPNASWANGFKKET